MRSAGIDLGGMTNAELLEYGLSIGADVKSKMKKAELIAAIEEAL